jgi:hypothetical protein
MDVLLGIVTTFIVIISFTNIDYLLSLGCIVLD